MENTEIEAIYKENLGLGHQTALRMVFNHGWYAGASQTPVVGSPDKSKAAAAPTTIMRATRRID